MHNRFFRGGRIRFTLQTELQIRFSSLDRVERKHPLSRLSICNLSTEEENRKEKRQKTERIIKNNNPMRNTNSLKFAVLEPGRITKVLRRDKLSDVWQRDDWSGEDEERANAQTSARSQ
jgi:hypothetical protein